MSKIENFVSAAADGTYGMANSLIGQIKTILLNDTKVAVISDTNPANTAMRVVVYQVGTQAHYIKMEVTSATQLRFGLMNLANNAALLTGTITVAADTNYRVQLLYSTKVHAVNINRTAGGAWFFLDCGDPAGWYVRGPNAAANIYYNGSDVAGTQPTPAYNYLGSNATWLSIPLRFVYGSIIKDYYSLYAWSFGSSELSDGYFFTYGGYNYLTMAASIILSDQVS